MSSAASPGSHPVQSDPPPPRGRSVVPWSWPAGARGLLAGWVILAALGLEIASRDVASTWMVSKRHPLRGLLGGRDAAPYTNRFLVGTPDEYEIENAAFNVPLPEGAQTAYQFGGGGGFGDPLERDPDLVRDDVLDELVSVDAARTEYGVVLRGSVDDLDLEVDHDATKKLRAERGESN